MAKLKAKRNRLAFLLLNYCVEYIVNSVTA